MFIGNDIPALRAGSLSEFSALLLPTPNIYRSLKIMKDMGVSPTAIEGLATWGKSMWPLGNWDYWK